MQIPWLFPIFIFSLTFNKIPWLLPSLEFPWLFPDRWTPWIPLFKSNDASLFTNYRPISLLPIFSKIFERIMYNRLYNYLKKYNILSESQFGFREGHSTYMALLVLLENIVNTLEKGHSAVGLFLDFKKAFDTVDHDLLLQKMNIYGIRGNVLNWFSSYLRNRKQTVIYNNHESDYKEIKCGVPQGSILGPLLFLIYINDLTNASKMFNSILFADDTSLFHAGKNPDNIVKEINDEIPNIISWLHANKLSLNLEKTNFILFSPKNAPKLNTDLLINHTKITEVNQTKFLGVIIDNNLNWSAHIRYIQNKIAKGIGIITKARKVFDYETLLSLYNSLIYPYITYCIHAWGNAFPTHIKPIVLLQKKAVRIINGVPPRSPTEILFKESDILKIDEVFKYSMGIFMFKFYHHKLPALFTKMFKNITDVHKHRTRSTSNLFMPTCTTTRMQKSLRYCGPKIWNYIVKHSDIKCSIGTFKKRMKKISRAPDFELQ